MDGDDIYLSAVTLGELQTGIELTRRQDPEKAAQIEEWLEHMPDLYKVLPVDGRVFREWAKLMHGRPDRLLIDAMIAATARIHRLTVVTRNTRDFKQFDVPLLDPFKQK